MSASTDAAPPPLRPDAPIAVTMGEPSGIGGEILIKAIGKRPSDLPPVLAIDDADRLSSVATALSSEIVIRPVESPKDALTAPPGVLPVLHRPLAAEARPGQPAPENAGAVTAAIEMAADLAMRGEVSAIVTNPITKNILYAAGFRFPGHTEFLGELCGSDGDPVMMLTGESVGLRVVPVTIHIPLGDVARTLSSAAIVHAVVVTAKSLRRDFGIAAPSIGVTGLNPHAGEGGSIGREEQTIIGPALRTLHQTLAADGVAVHGPLSADSAFHAESRRRYDAIVCQYHDQALIPLKTLDFYGGVNATLGLPIVRTSPDHGPALDIAGRGSASETSLAAAIRLAAAMSRRRFSLRG